MENNEKKLQDYDTTLANAKFKKITTGITAVVLAGAMIIGGSKVAKLLKGDVKAEPETTVTQETDQQNEEFGVLYLCEDFDINDEVAVNERAQAIYDISEKQVEVSDIKNIIYLVNEKFDKIDYKGKTTDEDKFKYVQELITKDCFQLLNDNIQDESERAIDLIKEEKEVKEVVEGQKDIYAYMFEASHPEKDSAFTIAQIVEEQNDNIKNSLVSHFEQTGKDLIYTIEGLKDANLSDGYGTVDYLDGMAKEPLFPGIKMDTNYVDSYTNSLFASWAKAEGIDYSKLLEGSNCASKTKEGKKYNASDAIKANSIESTTVKANDIKKGGKHVKTETSKKNTEVTTIKEKESSTVKVTEGTTRMPDGNKVEITTDKNGDGHGEVTEKGGDVVEEKTEISGGEVIDVITEEPTTNSKITISKEEPTTVTTTKANTTKVSTTAKTTTTTTTTEHEYIYVDEDLEDIPILTEEEYNKSTAKSSAIAVGGFMSLVPLAYVYKKKRK